MPFVVICHRTCPKNIERVLMRFVSMKLKVSMNQDDKSLKVSDHYIKIMSSLRG
jgi:hypothetical protein